MMEEDALDERSTADASEVRVIAPYYLCSL
jgi:hypothetical protein